MAEAKAWVIIPKLDKKKNECVLDMRPLVQCKDCKYRSKEMYDYYGNPEDKVYVCQINDVAKKPDWFCADGERRDAD